jgi:hypothetical protein
VLKEALSKASFFFSLPYSCMLVQKLNIPEDSLFADLDLEKFNSLKFAVYLIDHDWNYLFVNDFVKNNLGGRADSLSGKNMWDYFPELANAGDFVKLKQNMEAGIHVNITTTSPINGHRLNIVGYPIRDCYFFYASQLPQKENLLNELRTAMDR